VTAVVPARPRQLRTYTDGQAGEAGLRSYVLADVVRRVAEGHSLQVSAWHTAGAGPAEGRELATAWAALNVHPLEPAAEPPAALDLAIGPEPGQPGVRWLRAGPARSDGGAGMSPAAVSGRGLDPLALRLVFLQRHYREPVELGWAALAAADRTVREWRAMVAGWANSPSKPMPAQYPADVRHAFDDDLDTPAALRTVAALAADPQIPPGAKFETFVHLDHLLGLDLARDIGR
jgi:hypothetical protein